MPPICVELTRIFGSCVFAETGATTTSTCDVPGTFGNHPPFTILSQTVSAPTCTSTIVGVGTPATVTFTISETLTLTIQNANGAVATCTTTLSFSGSTTLPVPLPNTTITCQGVQVIITGITITGAGGTLTITVTADVCAVIKSTANIPYLLPEEPALCPTPGPCGPQCPLPPFVPFTTG